MSKEKSLPLVWGFDGKGEWEAPSQVLDPDMADEPQETWCKEDCLKWRIRVMEDGRFTCTDSDKYLLDELLGQRKTRDQLQSLQAKIELYEESLRGMTTFADSLGTRITLLPADKYAK